MRAFERWGLKSGRGAPADPLTAEPPADADALAAEIQRLSELNRSKPRLEVERRLLALRNLAGIDLVQGAAPVPAHPEPDYASLPPADGLVEISASELTAPMLRAAILGHGCLLVRELVPRAPAVRLGQEIDHAFSQRERHDAGKRHDGSYFEPFVGDPRRGQELPRNWIKNGGGLLAVDSPLLSFEMLELFAQAGLPALACEYLGEPALIAADKSTLRRAEPTVGGAWHQDGKFMGEVNALNVWLALSRCGDEAPGLDIVARRFDRHVETHVEPGFENMVPHHVAEQVAGDVAIQRPIFEPGDALLFDELFLHRTGSDPNMPKPRFAIENWFFGASGFPADYAPLAV
jgi:hypothetical protein